MAPLRNAGIPVALMVGGGNGGTEELARENISLVANILGKPEKARICLRGVTKSLQTSNLRLRHTRANASRKSFTCAPPKANLLRRGKRATRTSSSRSLAATMLARAWVSRQKSTQSKLRRGTPTLSC